MDRNVRRILILFVFSVLLMPPLGWAGQTSPQQAAKFLESLGSKTVNVLRSSGSSLAQKEKTVRTLIGESFDFRKIGRFVLGRAWKKATSDQRDQYQSLFREFILRSYTRRLGGYAGQSFKITGTKPIGKSDVLVLTRISRPSGPPILAGWRVRNGSNGYKILDVMVSGVSMAVTQRSEFRSVVRRQGVGGLIEMLRLQVSRFDVRGS